MKALSLKQPWAWLLLGPKPVENRTWPLWNWFRRNDLPVRVYIHASKSRSDMTKDLYDWIIGRLSNDETIEFQKAYPNLEFGAIIGTVDIIDCIHISEFEIPEYIAPWFFGDFGFIRDNPVRFDKPIYCPGQLGFFKPKISLPAVRAVFRI